MYLATYEQVVLRFNVYSNRRTSYGLLQLSTALCDIYNRNAKPICFYRLINYKMCYSIMINYVYNDSNMIGFFHFSAHSSSERAKVPTNA